MKKTFLMMAAIALTTACNVSKPQYQSVDEYPTKSGSVAEVQYTPACTQFSVWSPNADTVILNLYADAVVAEPEQSLMMKRQKDGAWTAKINGDCVGKFYTFEVYDPASTWPVHETPGIFAKAVSINGERGAIIDLAKTNPEGWNEDIRPALAGVEDAIIYEMHHRDFSIHPTSGIEHAGKFLALTEPGTQTAEGMATGIDHLKQLGVTHIQFLPSYDFGSIDEKNADGEAVVLESGAAAGGKYNWGYDPKNYNVPEGSYSTNAADPACRIIEFKQMVMAAHKAGIRVILDVVYNHTYDVEHSNFTQTCPNYFYRTTPDGYLGNASGCGNETASNRAMMRKFMLESVRYWAEEYHLDGFRFDLMGIHDIETMNAIRQAVDGVDPSIFIYGEGWAASSPALPEEKLAMKANAARMPGIAAFGDEMRDGLRGPWSSDEEGAFLIGNPRHEMSLKFGVVGAIEHPQIDYAQVNYSKAPWALQPTQMISYVSCHDDMCLADRIKATAVKADDAQRIRLHKLAESVALTSQGVPFIWCGDEMMRDKKGVHNSYNSPDSINTIPWGNKTQYKEVFDYMKDLLALRKAHPAFHMGSADLVRQHLEFLPVKQQNVVAYRLKDHAAGDAWENIIVVYNSNPKNIRIDVPEGIYTVVCRDGAINSDGLAQFKGAKLTVPAQSALIMYK